MISRRHYAQFVKTLSQLQDQGRRISRIYSKENPCEVDIELMLEKYGFHIDAVPLADFGVEAWSTPSKRVVYIDIDLINRESRTRRYRMTLAEEFAHSILHRKIYDGVENFDQWLAKWSQIPDDVYENLDRNAKELAGIILMPEETFLKRLVMSRDQCLRALGGTKSPAGDQQSRIITDVTRKLMDDFNINEEPCRRRISRLTYPNRFFDIR